MGVPPEKILPHSEKFASKFFLHFVELSYKHSSKNFSLLANFAQNSDCNLGAHFIPTTLENGLAAFAGHASPKAMHFSTLTSFWLVCPLWHNARYYSRLHLSCQVQLNPENFPRKFGYYPQFYREKRKLWKNHR